MYKFFTFVIISLLCVNLYSQTQNVRESTVNLKEQVFVPNGEEAEDYMPSLFPRAGNTESVLFQVLNQTDEKINYETPNRNNLDKSKGNSILTDWKEIETIKLQSLIPANGDLGVKFNCWQKKLEVVSPFALSEEVKTAVAKAPRWVRSYLENTLSKVTTGNMQTTLAQMIINAENPYIDEIAFAIAFTTPEFLNSSYCKPQIFEENAKLIYSHDSDLAYVQVVDYGVCGIDDNYYSTVKYVRLDSNSNEVTVEIPFDIYYMYIVHPKISDEYETYINPETRETNSDNSVHTYNIADPPTGVFWRDYLYTHTEINEKATQENDSTIYYSILKEQVSKSKYLWDDTKNNDSDAIHCVTQWINDVMEFTSESERPHQPVRIYDLHIGRCGEHEDITAAAARACLIPTRDCEAYSSDHVWNEFWDLKWWQWEPVNNSYKNNYCYSKGWGKRFGSIDSRVSCGSSVHVMDQYFDSTSTLVIYALDGNSKPIEGAFILLAVAGALDETASIYLDSYGITDNEGKCTFVVSSGKRQYYARMTSSTGNYPTTNTVTSIASNPIPNKTYIKQLKAYGKKTLKTATMVEDPAMPMERYKIKAIVNVEKNVTNWLVYFNDFENSHTYDISDGGKLSLFYSDDANYNKCSLTTAFNAYKSSVADISGKDTIEIILPHDQLSYVWLKNINTVSNYVLASAEFTLYCDPAVSVNENTENKSETLSQNVPNPFNNSTSIDFVLSDATNVTLTVYNSLGNQVAVLANGQLSAGKHNITWDGTNSNGNQCNSGLYYYELRTDKGKFVKKMSLLK